MADHEAQANRCLPKADCKVNAPEKIHQPSGAVLPSTHVAVITPEMGACLNLHVDRIPHRSPDFGEVVVRISWTGICRTDVCFSIGPEPGFPALNHIAGHEGIGHVVQSHDPLLLGQPVATRYLASHCHSCAYCLRGVPESCVHQLNFPKHYNGTFQQYITVPWTSLMPLPYWIFEGGTSTFNTTPARYTAALCSGSAALKALRAANLLPNDVVVITGITGAIGHLAGQLAKSVFGAKVIGVDWEWKADSFPGDAHRIYDIFVAAEKVAEKTDDEHISGGLEAAILVACSKLRSFGFCSLMADAVIMAASSASGMGKLPNYVRDGGCVIHVGVPRGKHFVNMPLATLVERQLRVQGTMMGSREEAYQMMEYIRQGKIKPVVTMIELEGIGKCMDRFEGYQNVGKMIARVGGTMLDDGLLTHRH